VGLKQEEPAACFDWVGPSLCDHVLVCRCDLTVKFRSDLRLPLIYIKRVIEGKMKTTQEMLMEAKSKIDGTCDVRNGVILKRRQGQTDEEALKFAIDATGYTNIRFIPAPMMTSLPYSNSPMRPVESRIEEALEGADMLYFKERGIRENKMWYRNRVWRPYLNFCPWHAKRAKLIEERERLNIPTLKELAMRKISGYNIALGTTEGRPHIISSMDNLDGNKSIEAMAKHARPADILTEPLKKSLEVVPEALTLMYNAMGTLNKLSTEEPVVSIKRCDGMYLGASSGSYLEQVKVFEIMGEGEEASLIRKASQKKVHSHHAVMYSIADFLAGYEPLQSIFTQNMKNEHYTDVGQKQKTRESWEKWLAKVRTYEIPSEFFIGLERITNMTRMLLERGLLISVGMKWARGGADYLAKRLGIKFGEEWKKAFGDGDFSSLDQSIHYIFIQLFYQMAGVYYKRDHPSYAEMMRAIDFIARTVAARVVRFFQRLWAIVIGKMPSGAWMTSHGDSWIVGLWFFMFGVMKIMKAPQEMREKMEADLISRVINIVVYGDDHIMTTDRGNTQQYFNMIQFSLWCKVYLGAEMRDIRPDVPYTVQTRNGYRTSEGIVYLKHYNVRNRSFYQEGGQQPYYLPYRSMSDYQIKSVWGRECKDRDIYDFILSLIGHSYGTYGSNFNAYSWLKAAYVSAFRILEKDGITPQDTLGTAINRSHTNIDYVKKARQADISMENLQKGFPTWETLIKKNVYDPVYHEATRNDFLER